MKKRFGANCPKELIQSEEANKKVTLYYFKAFDVNKVLVKQHTTGNYYLYNTETKVLRAFQKKKHIVYITMCEGNLRSGKFLYPSDVQNIIDNFLFTPQIN